MTDSDFQTLRELVLSTGYLPVHGKGQAIVHEVERLTYRKGPDKTFALRELCEELETEGYLPKTKAQQLLDGVEQLRQND